MSKPLTVYININRRLIKRKSSFLLNQLKVTKIKPNICAWDGIHLIMSCRRETCSSALWRKHSYRRLKGTETEMVPACWSVPTKPLPVIRLPGVYLCRCFPDVCWPRGSLTASIKDSAAIRLRWPRGATPSCVSLSRSDGLIVRGGQVSMTTRWVRYWGRRGVRQVDRLTDTPTSLHEQSKVTASFK